MTDLLECRKEIDVIDKEILRLFEKRMKVCEDVAEYKIHTGKQVLDPKREQDKLDVLKNQAHGSFNSLGAQELFQQIMAISRKRQYQLLTEHGIYGERNFTTVKHVPLENATVVFQGVEGAYSYAAMRQYFGKNIESYHVKTWRTAMEDVTHEKADYAVLPIENSTAGIVADIYDLLMEYKLYIVGEQIIRVDHVLLGMPDAQIGDIREVCSHPQGLAQCKEYLEEHRGWKTTAVTNTAAAAQKVSADQDKTHAAIASRAAGEIYNLKVLAENICKNDSNVTRFIILAKKPVIVATQMLHTMINNPRPTRAEVTDIANAIYYRTDALMLSGETAYGKYPVEAVKTMAKIAAQAEKDKLAENDIRIPLDENSNDVTAFLAKQAVKATTKLNIRAIITDSFSGRTARNIAAFRGKYPVLAICYKEKTMRHLALSYGVEAIYMPEKANGQAYYFAALRKLLDDGVLSESDMVAYLSSGKHGTQTSFLEINVLPNRNRYL